MREAFQIRTIHLDPAIAMGFFVLFAIALHQALQQAFHLQTAFGNGSPEQTDEIRQTAFEASKQRIRPHFMSSNHDLRAGHTHPLSIQQRYRLAPLHCTPSNGWNAILLYLFLLPPPFLLLERRKNEENKYAKQKQNKKKNKRN